MSSAQPEWYEPPENEDGSTNVVQVARDVSVFVKEVGGYVLEAESILAEIREQLPRRGSLTDLYLELHEVFQFVKAKWDYADDALLTVALLTSYEEDARHDGRPMR